MANIVLDLPTNIEKIILAYSGGLDSSCLLHLLIQNPNWQNKLTAVYINHQLSSNADAWQTHCQKICETYGIHFQAYKIDIKNISAGESLEAKAREARYAVLGQLIDANSVLLTAHHQDDQAETLLINACRGSGVAGIAAMPYEKAFAQGRHIRPLLMQTRAHLLEYAQQHQLQWIEDESNRNLDFDRNFLRHEIIPRLRSHWPAITQTLARVANHATEALTLLETVAYQDSQRCIDTTKKTLFIHELVQLPEVQQKNLVRYWCKLLGMALPDHKHLQRIFTEVIAAKHDAMPVVSWLGGEVRRFDHRLYGIVKPIIKEQESYHWRWQNEEMLLLNNGRLCILKNQKQGIESAMLTCPLTIRYRQGGEKIQPYPRSENHLLKHLLQEWQVPPWERASLPLIYHKDTLVSVAGYCYNRELYTENSDTAIKFEYLKSIL